MAVLKKKTSEPKSVPYQSKHIPLIGVIEGIDWAELLLYLQDKGVYVPFIRHDINLDFSRYTIVQLGAERLHKIYDFAYKRAKQICEICHKHVEPYKEKFIKKNSKSMLSYEYYEATTEGKIHDELSYDWKKGTFTLKKLMYVCPDCYLIARLDLARLQGKLNEAANVFVKLNGWEKVEAATYINYAFNLQDEWALKAWKPDLEVIIQNLIKRVPISTSTPLGNMQKKK